MLLKFLFHAGSKIIKKQCIPANGLQKSFGRWSGNFAFQFKYAFFIFFFLDWIIRQVFDTVYFKFYIAVYQKFCDFTDIGYFERSCK